MTLQCRDAGIDGMILDLERRGKELRQAHFDTQISVHGLADLDWLRQHFPGRIICRINGGEALNKDEVIAAADLGADELLLPMVTGTDEVERVRDWLPAKIHLGIMVETNEAVARAEALSACDISRAYVGLNDLAIAGGYANIFRPLIDGTIEHLRNIFTGPFGVAGLTHPALGSPIPSILFLAEMQRLAIDFTFLRRSFYRDLKHFAAPDIIAAVRDGWKDSQLDKLQPRAQLQAAIMAMETEVSPQDR